MIASLRGIIGKQQPGEATVDVQGVGYRVHMPINDWDEILEAANITLYISTYVREDRLDLYGFLQDSTRVLFEELIELSGVGPRMALELCAVPRELLARAVAEKNASVLSSIKGVGRKTAEKLLVELSNLAERAPEVFAGQDGRTAGARFDQDTVAALTQLGFATNDVLRVLETLPAELQTTEERVTAALRSL